GLGGGGGGGKALWGLWGPEAVWARLVREGMGMRRPLVFVSVLATIWLPAMVAAAPGAGSPSAPVAGSAASSNFQLVGHDPLFGRGMNSALAIYGHYLDGGKRTASSDESGPAHGGPHP